METVSTLLAICAGNSPLTGEFPAQSPVTQSFDVFFDLRLNKRLSKQPRGWWFEKPSRPLWRHCNVYFTQFVYTQCKVLHVPYAMSSLTGSDHVEARTWWRHQMEIFSALLAFGEFPAQRPVRRSFGVFFDLCLNKRLIKQSWGWWFETLSRPLWRHCNENKIRCNVISGAAQSLNQGKKA